MLNFFYFAATPAKNYRNLIMTRTIELNRPTEVSFSDTKTAFAGKTGADLRFSYYIFRMMQYPWFVAISSFISLLALKLYLPVGSIIKASVFRQFCGGETLEESVQVINKLSKYHIGAILDFAVEGSLVDEDFEKTKNEIIRVIRFAQGNPDIPYGCLKPTGIARLELLEKVSANQHLSENEKAEFERTRKRLDEICAVAYHCEKPIYIDAEESWIQPAIDKMVEEMMKKYNRQQAIISTTLQMYRHDRLRYLENIINEFRTENYFLGVKIVRGAYIEKENKRAQKQGYPTPVNPNKQKTDADYNAAMRLILANIDHVVLCAGTHNEESCQVVMSEMKKLGLANNHPNVWFSQLFGMSDHISYNLAAAGYNVTKYLPYGPVRSTIPYLVRRAEENSAIAGQMNKEFRLIIQETARRKKELNR